MRRVLATAAAAVAAIGIVSPPAEALENGLARTPPMGWNTWNTFECDINETLVKQTTDLMGSSGMRDRGYTYVNLDDCWMTKSRDGNGNLVADPAKFPGGLKALGDYIHARGMKFGIYESAGTETCQHYPGSLGHEQADATTFASWPSKARYPGRFGTKPALSSSGRWSRATRPTFIWLSRRPRSNMPESARF